MLRSIPLGVEDFKRLVEEDFYFVDKTLLIKDLLDTKAMVNLFARPRRFGKTLNMSMLRYFFEQTAEGKSNAHLFKGLKIDAEGEKYMRHMGQYPVISISLKSMCKKTFDKNIAEFKRLVSAEFRRHNYILKKAELFEVERNDYNQICNREGEIELYESSLEFLSNLLCNACEKKVIILIDEYDVPLQNAWLRGFYDDMVDFIRSIFDTCLKTNDALEFGVLTGCLRISKESIFTGLNNLKVFSISEVAFSDYFGFTDEDVRQMLSYYGLEAHHNEAKIWYDGYHFGKTEMYCPWDVTNHCFALRKDPNAKPLSYWINTSSNDIIRQFISTADATVQYDIERMMDGEAIRKPIHQELTYRDLKDNKENLWSMLYMTGYLTHTEILDNDEMMLTIPNYQIRKIFRLRILEWFKAYFAEASRRPDLTEFCRAFREGDADKAQKLFTQYMQQVISIRDNNVPDTIKENFYHGIMLGLFSHMTNWVVLSNQEAGDGYSDITIRIPAEKIGIVVEIKFREDEKLEEGVEEALEQIDKKHYIEVFEKEGYTTILKFGVACYKKRCRIKLG